MTCEFSDNQLKCACQSSSCSTDQQKCKLVRDSSKLYLHPEIEHYELAIPIDTDIEEQYRYKFCNTLVQMIIDVRELTELAQKISPPTACAKNCECNSEDSNCLDKLKEIAQFGSRLEHRALYWASENVAIMPSSKRLRIELAHFAQFAKEYGSKMVSRSDALVKQVAGKNGSHTDRKQLSNSVYLRDSSPTAYLNLYQWNEAAVTREFATAEERTRMVDQLVADTYWSKINTVFAAGQGDVSMALIKDDIGNWQLKSFDNSPGKLLETYESMALAAVQSVEKSINKGDLVKASSELSFANEISLGSTSGGHHRQSTHHLELLRIETAREIIEIGKQMSQQKSELMAKISELKTEIGEKCNGLNIEDECSGLTKELAESKAALTEEIKKGNGAQESDVDKAQKEYEEKLKKFTMADIELSRTKDALKKINEISVSQIQQRLDFLDNTLTDIISTHVSEDVTPTVPAAVSGTSP